jgi:hypothetical protein
VPNHCGSDIPLLLNVSTNRYSAFAPGRWHVNAFGVSLNSSVILKANRGIVILNEALLSIPVRYDSQYLIAFRFIPLTIFLHSNINVVTLPRPVWFNGTRKIMWIVRISIILSINNPYNLSWLNTARPPFHGNLKGDPIIRFRG